jgi:RecA/RadA recombinase
MEQSSKVVQLRELLAEKFPGLRLRADALAAKTRAVWRTGLASLDSTLHGGLAKSALTELTGKTGCGSALVIHQLLRRANETNQFVALIDGCDSFDAAALEQEVLSRLLWIRCRTANEAMKCADILLRDRNLPLVILDLKLNPAKELKKISATNWYRLQRIVEQGSTAVLVVTPRAMVNGAESRILLDTRFTLGATEQEQAELISRLHFKLQRERGNAEHVKKSA